MTPAGHSLGLGRDRCGLMSMLKSILRRASSFSCFSFSSILESLCSSDDILKNLAPWSSQQTPISGGQGGAGGGASDVQMRPANLHTLQPPRTCSTPRGTILALYSFLVFYPVLEIFCLLANGKSFSNCGVFTVCA